MLKEAHDIIEAYKKDTGKHINLDNYSNKERESFIKWAYEEPQRVHIFTQSIKRATVLIPNFSVTLSDKISAISQFHCPLCGTEPPARIMTIRIPPESYQSLEKRRLTKAFSAAIKDYLEKESFTYPKGTDLCVLIVFVICGGSKNKDLDNMSKALLDGLKGNLFHDDIDIVHLNSVKFKINELDKKDAYITVNIRPSKLLSNENVIFPIIRHKFCQDFIDLKDYLDQQPFS